MRYRGLSSLAIRDGVLATRAGPVYLISVPQPLERIHGLQNRCEIANNPSRIITSLRF
jgi:hypothetical protein